MRIRVALTQLGQLTATPWTVLLGREDDVKQG